MAQQKNPVIAINIVEVNNAPESFVRMHQAGPKMCALTASQPGFLGYQANFQTGILPMAGRYGGGALDMRQRLNPLPIYQYTVWTDKESHGQFHREHFVRAFEICAHCLPVIVNGPWEPVYDIVAAQMPEILSAGQIATMTGGARSGEDLQHYATPQRVVALCMQTVKPGEEDAFEEGIRATMEALSDSPGYLGYMLLRQDSVNPWGSLQLDPESMIQSIQTFGANPPSNPQPLFEDQVARVTPAEYLVHTEWESESLASSGLMRVILDRDVRELHNQGVIAHLVYGPYVKLFAPMMEQPSWRWALQ